MKRPPAYTNIMVGGLAALLTLVSLYFTSLYSYLLFHTLIELFCIVVGAAIFVIVWNTRRLIDNGYLVFIGISFLFVALLDALHTLSYDGMGVFPGAGANLPTQLWVANRYWQSLTFVIAPLFLGKKPAARWVLVGGIVLVALVLASIVVWPIFPQAYVDGQGLTRFKIVSEYVISGLLLLGGFLVWQRRAAFDPTIWRLLIAAMVFNVGAELAFTFYVGVYDFSNLVGHLFKVVSFFCIYKAMVEAALVKPYSLLFLELKRSEAGLREERDLISAILDVAGALVVVLDTQGRIVRFNRACEETTGYRQAEVIGIPFWDQLLLAEEVEPVKAVFGRLMAGQFPYFFENHWLTRSGERRLIAWSNTMLHDQKGGVVYVIGTGIDITERRQREEQLQAQNEELDAFAHTVAHDLKNPLQLIIGSAELLEEVASDLTPEESSLLVTKIGRTGRKMDNIIHELLLLAGVRKAEISLQPLDMKPLIEGALLRLGDLIAESGAEILVPDTWSPALGHGPWIEEVWTNYLSNAIKYGGTPPRIQLGCTPGTQAPAPIRSAESKIVFWVRDNGPGVDPEAVDVIFAPFTQLAQVRARGHGLGLSIVRRIVERLGGEVGMVSSPPDEQGSTFYFTLPAAPPPHVQPAIRQAAQLEDRPGA